METREAIAVFISPRNLDGREGVCFRQLAEQTLRTLNDLNNVQGIVYTEPHHRSWIEDIQPDHSTLQIRDSGPHGPSNLKVKVQMAFRELFREGYDRVWAMAADIPALTKDTLKTSFERLRRDGSRAVVGPSPDGGFYLLGLKALPGPWFEDVPFFSGKTYDRLIDELGRHVEEVVTLTSLQDIDVLGDWLVIDPDLLFKHWSWLIDWLTAYLRSQNVTLTTRIESALLFLGRTLRAPPLSLSILS